MKGKSVQRFQFSQRLYNGLTFSKNIDVKFQQKIFLFCFWFTSFIIQIVFMRRGKNFFRKNTMFSRFPNSRIIFYKKT